MKTSALLLAITIHLAAACDHDHATIGTCSITPIGVQALSEDLDLDGSADHAPFMLAKVTAGCAITKAITPAALYETDGDATILRGFGTSMMLSSTCVLWTWPNAKHVSGQWAFAVTPLNGTATGVYSGNIADMSEGTALPAWYVDGAWSVSLPTGIPSSCD